SIGHLRTLQGHSGPEGVVFGQKSEVVLPYPLSSTCAVFQGYHEQRESRQKGLRSSILGVEQTTPDHRARRHRWTVYRRPLSLCCCTWLLPSPNRLSAARSCCCSPPC